MRCQVAYMNVGACARPTVEYLGLLFPKYSFSIGANDMSGGASNYAIYVEIDPRKDASALDRIRDNAATYRDAWEHGYSVAFYENQK